MFGMCTVVRVHSSFMTHMCFQVWNEEDQRSRRSLKCPFNDTGKVISLSLCTAHCWFADVCDVSVPDFSQKNVWENVSVSLARGQMNNFGSLLWWNLSAPCRLKGEVWPCQPQVNCRGRQGPRQQLTNGTWRQDSKGQWVRKLILNLGFSVFTCFPFSIKLSRHILML